MLFDKKLASFAASLRTEHNIPMEVRLWNGQSYQLGDGPKVTVHVPRPSALSYLVNPDLLKLGEAYVEGHIRIEGRLRDVFEVGQKLARGAAASRKLFDIKRMALHTKTRDKKAIEYHYDVSNEFYRMFLDANMVYSCAYFRSEEDGLDKAQEQKLDHILTKLMVKPGDRFLDIGCGWGAMIVRAAKNYGARATGVTLSEKQYEYCRELIERERLGDRCEVRLQDYRDIPGSGVYDKICSVGMFEHVGRKNLSVYFGKINDLLARDGLLMNHGITASDPDSQEVALGAGEFIDRYVFPDGELPHISLAMREIEAAGLEPVDAESLRRHYAKTCGIWAERLEASKQRAIELAGDRRYRIWSIYLVGCAHAFAHNWINIYQILCAKKGKDTVNPLPMTRDYMYLPR
jgi:cyclopropane-fatty-acyl-phospholipid synthase